MVKRLDVVKKYSERARRLKPDKHIAVENVLISYSPAPADRMNNSLNLSVDQGLYKWSPATLGLMWQGLQELYRLYDEGQLED